MATLDKAYTEALEHFKDSSIHGVRINFSLNGFDMVADIKRSVYSFELPQIYNIRAVVNCVE